MIGRANQLDDFSLQYPSAWPEKKNIKSCHDLSGNYIATGKYVEQSEAPLFSHLSIENLLMLGSFGGSVNTFQLDYEDNKGILDITYFGSNLIAKEDYGSVPPKYKKELRLEVSGRCHHGLFVINHIRPWGGNGESYPTKSESISMLTIAADDSLIIKHSSITWISKWFGLSIKQTRIDGWYMFERE